MSPFKIDLTALPIKRWSLFLHLFSTGWAGDALWPMGCGRSDIVLSPRAKALSSFADSAVMIVKWPVKTWSGPLETERSCGGKIKVPSDSQNTVPSCDPCDHPASWPLSWIQPSEWAQVKAAAKSPKNCEK